MNFLYLLDWDSFWHSLVVFALVKKTNFFLLFSLFLLLFIGSIFQYYSLVSLYYFNQFLVLSTLSKKSPCTVALVLLYRPPSCNVISGPCSLRSITIVAPSLIICNVEGLLQDCLNGEFVRLGPNPKFEPVAGYH